MKMLKFAAYGTLAASPLAVVSPASATILTFDQDATSDGVSNFEPIDPTYGDNVVALVDTNGNGYGVGL